MAEEERFGEIETEEAHRKVDKDDDDMEFIVVNEG